MGLASRWLTFVALFVARVPLMSAIVSPFVGDSPFLEIIGSSPSSGPANCIPFGAGSFGPFKGFVYANVPPFQVAPYARIAFDLGGLASRTIQLDIALSSTTTNGGTIQNSNGFTTVGATCPGA